MMNPRPAFPCRVYGVRRGVSSASIGLAAILHLSFVLIVRAATDKKPCAVVIGGIANVDGAIGGSNEECARRQGGVPISSLQPNPTTLTEAYSQMDTLQESSFLEKASPDLGLTPPDIQESLGFDLGSDVDVRRVRHCGELRNHPEHERARDDASKVIKGLSESGRCAAISVVGHSDGGAIAYHAATQSGVPGLRLVTVNSLLSDALHPDASRLTKTPPQGSRPKPENVDEWVNIFDTADPLSRPIFEKGVLNLENRENCAFVVHHWSYRCRGVDKLIKAYVGGEGIDVFLRAANDEAPLPPILSAEDGVLGEQGNPILGKRESLITLGDLAVPKAAVAIALPGSAGQVRSYEVLLPGALPDLELKRRYESGELTRGRPPISLWGALANASGRLTGLSNEFFQDEAAFRGGIAAGVVPVRSEDAVEGRLASIERQRGSESKQSIDFVKNSDDSSLSKSGLQSSLGDGKSTLGEFGHHYGQPKSPDPCKNGCVEVYGGGSLISDSSLKWRGDLSGSRPNGNPAMESGGSASAGESEGAVPMLRRESPLDVASGGPNSALVMGGSGLLVGNQSSERLGSASEARASAVRAGEPSSRGTGGGNPVAAGLLVGAVGGAAVGALVGGPVGAAAGALVGAVGGVIWGFWIGR